MRLQPPLCFAVLLIFSAAGSGAAGSRLKLSDAELRTVGRRVWQNECGGTVEGLTSWNSGEGFASLGIGHFIWYPKGMEGPFDESFPGLVRFLDERKVPLPAVLQKNRDCPWTSKRAFDAAKNSADMKALRACLADTVHLQAEFLVMRLEAALPKMLAAAGHQKAGAVKARFDALLQTPAGVFALVDYVNFKGEGVLPTERYKGQGWGLLQVLEGMPSSIPRGGEVMAFAYSAARVLRRRVENAPPERNESRWLKGWVSRVGAYAR